MAKPIKNTPTLYGKDSDRFLKEVRENENKKVSLEAYNKAISTYEKVMKKAKF